MPGTFAGSSDDTQHVLHAIHPAASGHGDSGRTRADDPSIRLTATWYCNADASRGPLSRCTTGHPDGPGADLYAALPRRLLSLRGSLVRVCADRCVVVRAIDCNCGRGAGVDLYADAYAVIAPLAAGRVSVRVSAVVPPATDR